MRAADAPTDGKAAQGGNVYNDSRGEHRCGQDFQRDTKHEETHLSKHINKIEAHVVNNYYYDSRGEHLPASYVSSLRDSS